MPISTIYDLLRRIVEQEFSDIIVYAAIEALPTGDARKLRLHAIDGSFIDVFVSITGRYSYHWQRTETAGNRITGTIMPLMRVGSPLAPFPNISTTVVN